MYLDYRYDMGLTVNAVAIPDPSEWEYEVGDLDTEGSRDATGYLHRAMVAQKVNYGFSWNCIEWEMQQTILAAVNTDKFTLNAPDPRNFNSRYTGDYYVGDRKGKSYYYWIGKEHVSVFRLQLKFIEY